MGVEPRGQECEEPRASVMVHVALIPIIPSLEDRFDGLVVKAFVRGLGLEALSIHGSDFITDILAATLPRARRFGVIGEDWSVSVHCGLVR